MIILKLSAAEVFALRGLVLDRLSDERQDVTREWCDILHNETVTIEQLAEKLLTMPLMGISK